VISTCEEAGVRCKLPSDAFSYSIARPRVVAGGGGPVIALDVVRHDRTLLIKRFIDIAGASAGLLLTMPLMAGIAILVRVTSGGPVVFRQLRYGLNKRTFTMYKFRTMWQDAESRQHEFERHNEMSGPVFKIKADPRTTPIGRILRRTSLDELPQLFNVLMGSMSLVGPRPLPVRDVSRFSDAWLMRRFSVKPGLTCLWQIAGRNDLDFDRWIELDLKYIDNWSLTLDLRILLRTVNVVVRGKGAA
jgi:exopolysaccharide biosynthesis polyprenyl glycosylphosphotransferase